MKTFIEWVIENSKKKILSEEYKKKQWRTLSTGGKRLNHKSPPDQLNNLLQGVCLIK